MADFPPETCRTGRVDSKNRPQRENFRLDSQVHSPGMSPEAGKNAHWLFNASRQRQLRARIDATFHHLAMARSCSGPGIAQQLP